MVQPGTPLIQTTQHYDDPHDLCLPSASPIETRPSSPAGSVEGPFSESAMAGVWHPRGKDGDLTLKDGDVEHGSEDDAIAPGVKQALERSAMLRVAWLGFGFLCVLTAINVVSTNVTVLYPDQGFNSLATVFFCNILGSLLAPLLNVRFPPWLIFLAAGGLYTVYDAALNWGEVPMFVFSVLIGFAGGALWVTEGSYVTATAKASGVPIGKLTSIFLTFFTANMTVGNVISLALQRLGVSRANMLYVMAGISGFGSLCLALVPTPPRSAAMAAVQTTAETSLVAKVKAIAALITRRPMAALIPLILWNGAVQSLAFANFPTFLPAALLEARPETLPMMYIAYGAFAALGSPLFGRVYDRAGLPPVMILMTLIATAMFAMTYLVILYLPTLLPLRADGSLDVDAHYGTIVAILVLSGGFLGALDSITTGTMNFVQSAWFPDGAETATAFAASRTVMCTGFVLLALVSNMGIWQVVLALNHTIMVAALGCLAWLVWCTPYGLAPAEMRRVLRAHAAGVDDEDGDEDKVDGVLSGQQGKSLGPDRRGEDASALLAGE
ncbi:hypothetical protein AMAG_13181 [Allomyces macrogynus ATCC 38327]|uniref:UNC93-like protein MFSD11 n=1 Tax=Allomyces macrogynus (strain ATCC 38327) TaxID=578462 RepID=A0A0L0SZU6_ALLM3|nr:hypothetical protein AMAG_13181 [Allomyces macrogynus ATCC 38327]|eukprot:KNE68006.1 hypothetical protein AMAG_13181 [Allomyces macrogynus ATCC 38327]